MAKPPYILLVYEDAHHDQLDKLVRRLRSSRAPLEAVTAAGDGGFIREVHAALTRGSTRCAFVLAVADGDRPGNLVRGFNGDLSVRANFLKLRREWLKNLRASVPEAVRSRVFCSVLRWSQESLLTAAPEILSAWTGSTDAAVSAFFAACTPNPTLVRDADFLGTYRKPLDCLDQLTRKFRGHKFGKNREGLDMMKRLVDQPDKVLDRSPDMKSLVKLLNRLGRRLQAPSP